MGLLIKNNASAKLAAGIGPADTSLTIEAAKEALFPVIVAPDHTYITIEDAQHNIEVVKVTARAASSPVMTVVRAQDGTTARTFVAGDIVEIRPCKAIWDDLAAGVTAIADSAVSSVNAHVADPTDAHAASAITNTPAGNIQATTVQAAINELDTEAVHRTGNETIDGTKTFSSPPAVPAGAFGVPELANGAKAYDLAFNAGYAYNYAADNLAVQTYNEVVVPRAITIEGEAGFLETVSAGAAVIVDILKNGVSIYTVKPQFAAGATALTAGTLATTALAAGDRVTFKVTQIGSTTPGARMRFTLKGRLA